MANEIFRVGKVSSIDYAAGLVRVVYPDKDNSVTAPLPMLCTEYNMPKVGDPVMVLHLSNGTEAGLVLGRYWSGNHKPPEGAEGLFRKDLGRTPGEFDVCTDARPERVMELFPHTVPTGLRHGTVTVRTEDGPVEVTTFRREAGYADGRHPDAVDFDATLAEDLARREFTVNAMALDENGMVIDRYGGQMDLFRSVIRCVGDPDRRFAEDALRMLRAVRFAAQLGFSIEKGTLDAIRRSARRAEKLSGGRIKAELEKILLSPRPELAGELLRLGLLAHLGGSPDCPGLLALREEPPEPVPRWRAFCRLTGFPIAALPVERALRRGVLHPEAEAVRALALSGGELAALGLEGPAIGAAQRRLAAHILSHPEDNTPARLLALARAELSGP